MVYFCAVLSSVFFVTKQYFENGGRALIPLFLKFVNLSDMMGLLENG